MARVHGSWSKLHEEEGHSTKSRLHLIFGISLNNQHRNILNARVTTMVCSKQWIWFVSFSRGQIRIWKWCELPDIVHTDHDCRFPFDLVQCLWKWRPHSSMHAIIHLKKKKERKEWKEEEEEENFTTWPWWNLSCLDVGMSRTDN